MSEFKSDKISENFARTSPANMELNQHMFLEDLANNIVPVYGEKLDLVKCELVPKNEDLKSSIKDIFSTVIEKSYDFGYSTHKNFNETILEFIQFITTNVVYKGFIVLELVKKSNESETKVGLELVKGNDIKIGKKYITQIINSEDDSHDKKIEIPIEKCIVIEFPEILGGIKKYQKIVSKIADFGNKAPMNLSIRGGLMKNDKDYNLTEHQKLYDLEFRKITSPYMWHHRAQFGGNKLFSTYYTFYRQLRFRKTQFLLRDFIISELDKIVGLLDKELNGKSKIKISGLTPIEDVENMLHAWKIGTLEIKTANEVFFN